VAVSGAPVLIAGGGIGGLAAALALSRRGIPVHIFEAAAEFAELGAGLQIGPNGARILMELGLEDGLRRHARRPERLIVRDGITGGRLSAMPLGETAFARFGAPYLVMSRHALHGLLLEAVRGAPGVTLTMGSRVASCQVMEESVFLGGANGEKPLEGLGLIAADGVHSVLRRHLFPDLRATASGKTALRALAPMPSWFTDGEENAVCVWMGPDAHLVHYPIGEYGRLNVVVVLRDEALPPDREAPVTAAHIGAALTRWSRDAREFVASAPDWTRWPLYTLPPLPSFSRGPFALIGDAAHPILPFLASGAVMAIEDAAVLADELARSPGDCARAFDRYATRRLPRLKHLQAAAARAGEIYHMSGAMRLARNLALAAMPRRALLARYDWLYGFHVDAGERT